MGVGMSKEPIVSLYINVNEITVEQFNFIVKFIDNFGTYIGYEQIEIKNYHSPLRLKGRLSLLTSRARDYFTNWNQKNLIRNIRIVDKSKENQ